MGYALFAQRKLLLNNQLNATELQQMQRANEQYFLATETAGLQQQLSSLLSSQANQLQPLYEDLANLSTTHAFDPKNCSDEDKLRYDQLSAAAKKGEDGAQEALDKFISENGKEKTEQEYDKDKTEIETKIQILQLKHKTQEEALNRKISQVSIKESAIEMEVKRLDTQVTAIQNQLKAIDEAESAAVDRATPKFKGLG